VSPCARRDGRDDAGTARLVVEAGGHRRPFRSYRRVRHPRAILVAWPSPRLTRPWRCADPGVQSEPQVTKGPLALSSPVSPGSTVEHMAHLPNGVPRLEALSRGECLRRLATQSVGRIGITVQALPVVLPVNFGLLGESVVFRTIPGTKLDAATNKAVVAFEVDSYEPDGRSGWSVLVIGRATRMVADEVGEAETLAIGAWPLDGQASHFVRIEGSQITGRQFCRPSAG